MSINILSVSHFMDNYAEEGSDNKGNEEEEKVLVNAAEEEFEQEDEEVDNKQQQSSTPENTPQKFIPNRSDNIPLGTFSCLFAVDNAIRAINDLGDLNRDVRHVSHWQNESFKDALFLPLQTTRHLFIREYKKPLKWPMQARRKFQIINSGGECIYYAAETSSILSRILFLRGIFPYKVNVISLNGEPVVEINGNPCFKNCLTIRDADGDLIGRILKNKRMFSQSYDLRAWDGTDLLNVKGPEGSNCCLFADCANDDFDVKLGDVSIGKICSEWEYALENMSGVFVPMKLDEMTMTLLLGAVFLIDLTFYQRRRDASFLGRFFLTFVLFGLFLLLLFFIAKK